MTDLVRIQRRVSKKHYLKTKRTYEYERLSIDIPKRFHRAIKSLLKENFDLNIVAENDSIIVTLTRQKAGH